MKEEKPHLKVLSQYEYIYDTFEKTGELINFFPHVRGEIVAAYRVEHPHYHYNESCGACIREMITTIYKWYKKVKQ